MASHTQKKNLEEQGEVSGPRDVKGQMKLSLVPTSLAEANLFVSRHHRHHKPVIGHKFSIGLSDGEAVRGVAIIGRPVSRYLDNGWTLEVTRCCTDGISNGCSMLYRAAWRVAQNLGYRRLITYLLYRETGASLRGAGFKLVGITKGGSWNRISRPRVDSAELGQKQLWELIGSPVPLIAASRIARKAPSDPSGNEKHLVAPGSPKSASGLISYNKGSAG
jgi:hypothetical protein